MCKVLLRKYAKKVKCALYIILEINPYLPYTENEKKKHENN